MPRNASIARKPLAFAGQGDLVAVGYMDTGNGAAAIAGGSALLLVLSQVLMSLQLPLAVVPTIKFTSDRAKLGALVMPRWLAWTAWAMAALIIALNVKLIYDSARDFLL